MSDVSASMATSGVGASTVNRMIGALLVKSGVISNVVPLG